MAAPHFWLGHAGAAVPLADGVSNLQPAAASGSAWAPSALAKVNDATLLNMFAFLEPRDLASAASVCRVFRAFACYEPFWCSHYIGHWGSSVGDEYKGSWRLAVLTRVCHSAIKASGLDVSLPAGLAAANASHASAAASVAAAAAAVHAQLLLDQRTRSCVLLHHFEPKPYLSSTAASRLLDPLLHDGSSGTDDLVAVGSAASAAIAAAAAVSPFDADRIVAATAASAATRGYPFASPAAHPGLVPRIHVPSLSRAAFLLRHELPGLPFVGAGGFDHWPARRLWSSPDALIPWCGDARFSLSHRAGAVHGRDAKLKMTMKEYVAYMRTVGAAAVPGAADVILAAGGAGGVAPAASAPPAAAAASMLSPAVLGNSGGGDEMPLYIFDGGFGEKAPPLLTHYDVPSLRLFPEDGFRPLGRMHRPDFRWLVVGPAKTGAPWHLDPHGTSAWNALLSGRKRWALYPPGTVPPGVSVKSDAGERVTDFTAPLSAAGWYLAVYPTLSPAEKPLEFVQRAGDLVYIPSGWWHQVLNLEETVSVTQNYVSAANLCNVMAEVFADGAEGLGQLEVDEGESGGSSKSGSKDGSGGRGGAASKRKDGSGSGTSLRPAEAAPASATSAGVASPAASEAPALSGAAAVPLPAAAHGASAAAALSDVDDVDSHGLRVQPALSNAVIAKMTATAAWLHCAEAVDPFAAPFLAFFRCFRGEFTALIGDASNALARATLAEAKRTLKGLAGMHAREAAGVASQFGQRAGWAPHIAAQASRAAAALRRSRIEGKRPLEALLAHDADHGVMAAWTDDAGQIGADFSGGGDGGEPAFTSFDHLATTFTDARAYYALAAHAAGVAAAAAAVLRSGPGPHGSVSLATPMVRIDALDLSALGGAAGAPGLAGPPRLVASTNVRTLGARVNPVLEVFPLRRCDEDDEDVDDDGGDESGSSTGESSAPSAEAQERSVVLKLFSMMATRDGDHSVNPQHALMAWLTEATALHALSQARDDGSAPWLCRAGIDDDDKPRAAASGSTGDTKADGPRLTVEVPAVFAAQTARRVEGHVRDALSFATPPLHAAAGTPGVRGREPFTPASGREPFTPAMSSDPACWISDGKLWPWPFIAIGRCSHGTVTFERARDAVVAAVAKGIRVQLKAAARAAATAAAVASAAANASTGGYGYGYPYGNMPVVAPGAAAATQMATAAHSDDSDSDDDSDDDDDSDSDSDDSADGAAAAAAAVGPKLPSLVELQRTHPLCYRAAEDFGAASVPWLAAALARLHRLPHLWCAYERLQGGLLAGTSALQSRESAASATVMLGLGADASAAVPSEHRRPLFPATPTAVHKEPAAGPVAESAAVPAPLDLLRFRSRPLLVVPGALHMLTAGAGIEVHASWHGYLTHLASLRMSALSRRLHMRSLPPHLLTQLEDFLPPLHRTHELLPPGAARFIKPAGAASGSAAAPGAGAGGRKSRSPLLLPAALQGDVTSENVIGRFGVDAPWPHTGSMSSGSASASAQVSASEALAAATAGWRPTSLIDFADGMLGDPAYEALAMHCSLFMAQPALLAAFCGEYARAADAAAAAGGSATDGAAKAGFEAATVAGMPVLEPAPASAHGRALAATAAAGVLPVSEAVRMLRLLLLHPVDGFMSIETCRPGLLGSCPDLRSLANALFRDA